MNPTLKYIIGIIGIVLFLVGIWYFSAIVLYIIVSAILAFLGHPLMTLLEKIHIKQYRIPNALSAFLVLFCLWLAVFGLVMAFVPLVINEVNTLASVNFDSILSVLNEPLEKYFEWFKEFGHLKTQQTFEEYLNEKMGTLLDASFISVVFSGITTAIGNIVVAFFVISFITYFFLKDSGLFIKGLMLFVPDRHNEGAQTALKSIKKLLTRYLVGVLIQISLIVILVTAGLWLSGVSFEHSLICGLIAGPINIIPYIGPWIGAGLGILIGIATNLHLPFYGGLDMLIFYMVLVYAIVHIIDNVLFQPVIFSSSVRAHPLEIFIVIMMAASIAGVGGMVLAIPLYTVLRVVAKEFLSEFKVVKQLTKNI